jgi:formylglycine-generating enzyme required for sulfatase activity
MHGNITEWCADWYDGKYYANFRADDPVGPSESSHRVTRGGSWGSVAGACRSAGRAGNVPWLRARGLGFRVARVPAESVPGTIAAPQPLKLQPIAAQTVEVGKQLTVAVAAENADTWKGELRYSLGPRKTLMPEAPVGAVIDPTSGVLTWTPTQAQGPGKYDLTVSVEGPDGQKETATIAITVTGATRGSNPMSGKEIAVDLGNGVKLELVLIPAGSFMMGDRVYKPVHKVNITKPFYLGKYLVTQRQWQAVMGSNPSRFKGPQNPVEQVSWKDCQVFLKKLSERSRHPHPGPLPEGEGEFRLPSEAQWEYACRAGSTTRYCYGDDESKLGEYAWYGVNSGKKTHRVGGKKPNAWGLYDMYGNVCEWCADWYDNGYYANSPVDDPTGPASGSNRVNRGGGLDNTARDCRSAGRYGRAPGDRIIVLGFRVARVPAE